MVGAYQRARLNQTEIALSLLELGGVLEPNERQFVGASAVAELIVNVNKFLRG
jgi:hypothetical protein